MACQGRGRALPKLQSIISTTVSQATGGLTVNIVRDNHLATQVGSDQSKSNTPNVMSENSLPGGPAPAWAQRIEYNNLMCTTPTWHDLLLLLLLCPRRANQRYLSINGDGSIKVHKQGGAGLP